MTDLAKKYTLSDLASLTGSKLVGNPQKTVQGVASLEEASEEDVSFLANPRYFSSMKQSKAGVICIHKDMESQVDSSKSFLVSQDPSMAFQIIAKLLLHLEETAFKGIHPQAVVHETAVIGKNVSIGPFVTIDRGVVIGDDTLIYPNVYVGPNASIGTSCILHSNSVVRENCILKNRVILQPGAVIGSCGFGYITNEKGHHVKLEQLGNVVLEDDVEIGANTTVDRARFKSTIIGRGTKLDNLVQIGHNVELGQDNIIVSQTGIAGSSKTGRLVIMGGQAGIVGHVEIASGTMIATRGGVSKSITEPGKYAGAPVMPLKEYNKQQVYLRKIEEYVNKIEALESRLKELESKLTS